MSELFNKDSDTIGLHLKNIYNSEELVEDSTTEDSSVVQKEGNRNISRKIKLYNLDAILSVGYRVNSKRDTQFRIWANSILKDYLIKGYSINEKRLLLENEKLREFQESVKILGNVLNHKSLSTEENSGLLKIISDYAYALDILDQYDYQSPEITATSGKEIYQISYEEAILQIKRVKEIYGNSELFGHEKDDSFQSSVATIYQTFGAQDLYPSIEEKAANLLYFITKTIPSVMGIKGLLPFCFYTFLRKMKSCLTPMEINA